MSNARQQLLHYIADVERCLAAGAVNVAGTGRLAHYQPLLVQLAQQVPTLQPIVELNHTVTTANERDAAEPLLHLAMQTRQLRAALGGLASDAPLADVPASGPWATAMPIEDLLRELSVIRSNSNRRKELLEGTKKPPDDLRFINEWLADAMGSRQETGDLATDALLPPFGTTLLPDLQHDGFQANNITRARRLVLLCRLDEAAGRAALLAEHPELAEYLE